jgi:hypothetical protein
MQSLGASTLVHVALEWSAIVVVVAATVVVVAATVVVVAATVVVVVGDADVVVEATATLDGETDVESVCESEHAMSSPAHPTATAAMCLTTSTRRRAQRGWC